MDGLLGFTGFTVLEPVVVYGPNRMRSTERKKKLAAYRARPMSLDLAQALAVDLSA